MSDESVTIRKMQASDLDVVRSWRNHSDVRLHMLTQHEITPEEHSQWFAAAEKNPLKQVMLVYEEEKPLGLVHFSTEKNDGVMDWGFYLVPHSPKGSGSKLARKALNFAFKQQGWHKVCGQVISTNTASRRFHLKTGFMLEGVLRQQAKINHEWLSLWCFGLLATDWVSQ